VTVCVSIFTSGIEPCHRNFNLDHLRSGIPAKTITLLSGLLIDEEQWKELVEKGGSGLQLGLNGQNGVH
jgi:hypothetical protein